MSENEKDILKQMSDALSKLDKDKQSYVLGVAEGMAIIRDSESHNADPVSA